MRILYYEATTDKKENPDQRLKELHRLIFSILYGEMVKREQEIVKEIDRLEKEFDKEFTSPNSGSKKQ